MSQKLDTARKGADGQTAKPWRISSPSASSSSGPSVTSPRSRRCDRLDRLSPCPLAPTTHDLYESIDGQCAPWIALLGSTPVIVTYAGIHIYNFRRPFAFAPHISPHVHMFACLHVRMLPCSPVDPHHRASSCTDTHQHAYLGDARHVWCFRAAGVACASGEGGARSVHARAQSAERA